MSDHHHSTVICEMAIDTLAVSEAELLERVGALESDFLTYKMLAAASLESIVQLTKRNKQLASRLDYLNAQLRDLLSTPCLACRRRQRSECAA